MAEAYPTRNCVVCQEPFVVKTNNKAHAKYCSKPCQRKGRQGKSVGGKLDATCLNCGKAFRYYPAQGPGKFCCRDCKHEHWRKNPSPERGFVDLTGQTFGRWTVLEYAGYRTLHHHWKVRCSCADQTETIVMSQSLKQGRSKSCGCIAKEGGPRPDTKACTKCGTVYPFTEKYFAKGYDEFRWGLTPWCRICYLPILRARHLKFRRRLKVEVLTHYGNGTPGCSQCGENRIEALTLDHVNNDGGDDRKKRGIGMQFYGLLKRSGFPQDTPLQVLCFNCNITKNWAKYPRM